MEKGGIGMGVESLRVGASPEFAQDPQDSEEEVRLLGGSVIMTKLQAIVNWGRKYFGKDVRDKDVFLVETVLKDSEKGFFLPSNHPGRR